MHRGSDKDYRYLLTRIIPRRRLSGERRAAIDGALAGGARIPCVRQAYLALEDLCALGEFRRDGLTHTERSVSLGYRSAREAVRLSLVMTADEWRSVTGREPAADRIVPSVFAGIISSLALNDSPKTIVSRVEEMLGLARHIVGGARAKLLFINNAPPVREWPRDSVAFLPQSEALKRRFYHACLTGSTPHTLIRLAGDHSGESAFDIDAGTGSVLLLPLLARDIRWAILEAHLPVDSLDRSALSSFSILGQGIVRLLENNRHLETMVSIDRLSRVHNRNYYELQLPLEIERANRSRSSFAFLMIDIDDFKKVNDTYGHDTGDGVLRLVAQTIRRSLRKIDLIFRYGGEEFVVLLPGAGADSARRTAERIRGVVARAELALEDGRKVKVTISVGGCIYPGNAQNENQLLRMADKALYEAKEEGKNRFVFHGE
jgi:diguanylate cyclase (GGDEF)-like protein